MFRHDQKHHVNRLASMWKQTDHEAMDAYYVQARHCQMCGQQAMWLADGRCSDCQDWVEFLHQPEAVDWTPNVLRIVAIIGCLFLIGWMAR